MLTTLRIKNLALVADLTLDLQPGCMAITGETGAGKSIIIGALNLVLGERADRTLIRSGSDSCSVEAVFDTKPLRAPLKTFLEENGLEPCEDHQLVIKRTFTSAGANRQFINGSPTTLGILATLGEWLVDMHGPHEHQSLLHASQQLAILDAFGNLQPMRDAFAEIARHRAVVESEKAALIIDEKTYAQQLDLLRFQTREISEAKLLPDEETQVQEEHKRASNSHKLLELSRTAQDLLSENEASLLTNAGLLGRLLHELKRIDAGAGELVGEHEQMLIHLHELQDGLSRYAEKMDIDPSRLAELEERLNLIHSLRRKYGSTLGEVIAFGESAAQKLQSLEQRDAELARLNNEIKKLDAELWAAGQKLSAARHKIIPQLNKSVIKQLKDLGFARCHFEISIATVDQAGAATSASRPALTGLDTIEFQFAPNVGEPPRPLRAIASSGEMARVMLALKTVLAKVDEIPVLVFDEIDANVGGETATVVGEKMRQIANQRQVLCITHLAPVAAQATSHYVVTKQIKDGRTISEITLLSQKDRVTELSRMLGGQSDAARKHAEELLKAAAS